MGVYYYLACKECKQKVFLGKSSGTQDHTFDPIRQLLDNHFTQNKNHTFQILDDAFNETELDEYNDLPAREEK